MEYYWIIRRMSNNKFEYRLKIVEFAKTRSVSKAARTFETTRKTVRKWVYRYEAEGVSGLKDKSKAPHYIPHKMTDDEEKQIENLRKRHSRWGAMHLRHRYRIPRSHTAIHRVIKQKKLVKKKKKRWRKRKDLRELKARYKAFEKNQIDVKDLSDIYRYWPFMRGLRLPRYEYTCRELSVGATFYAYANENNSTYASRFADYVAEHLKSYGIDTAKIYFQTDNGSEFIGSATKRINRLSAFQKALKKHKIQHGRIPPRASYLQGDVETFHRIVEDELYDIENYSSHTEFLGKAYAYQLYFNYVRENRWRDDKSPLQLLRERHPHLDEGILNLPPIRLEILLDEESKGGYHVPGSVPCII